MACNDCVYYSFRADECRRNAPVAYGKDGDARWPKLTHHDQYEWCGQFKSDERLIKDKNIVREPGRYGDQMPWFDTDDEREKWRERQVDDAKQRIAAWEDK